MSKRHLRNRKRLTGRGMVSLAQIQVSACEALALQILSLDAQQGIAAEILQLIRGTIPETQKGHGLALPSMAGMATGQVHSCGGDLEVCLQYLEPWSVF